MLRPHEASETRRPYPLVQASRTDPAGRERVPIRSATSVEVLGMLHIPAGPKITPFGTPLTQRTPDAWNFYVIDLF